MSNFRREYPELKNFMNLIYNDPNIRDPEKFSHLVNCLSGEVLGTVKATTDHSCHAYNKYAREGYESRVKIKRFC